MSRTAAGRCYVVQWSCSADGRSLALQDTVWTMVGACTRRNEALRQGSWLCARWGPRILESLSGREALRFPADDYDYVLVLLNRSSL